MPLPYRILSGELRNIDGGTNYSPVEATAVQVTDGRIEVGGVHEPPHVNLGDDALTSAQARALAALEAADEVDRWAKRWPRLNRNPTNGMPV